MSHLRNNCESGGALCWLLAIAIMLAFFCGGCKRGDDLRKLNTVDLQMGQSF